MQDSAARSVFSCDVLYIGGQSTCLELNVDKEGVLVDIALQFNVVPGIPFGSVAPISNTCTRFLHSFLTFLD